MPARLHDVMSAGTVKRTVSKPAQRSPQKTARHLGAELPMAKRMGSASFPLPAAPRPHPHFKAPRRADMPARFVDGREAGRSAVMPGGKMTSGDRLRRQAGVHGARLTNGAQGRCRRTHDREQKRQREKALSRVHKRTSMERSKLASLASANGVPDGALKDVVDLTLDEIHGRAGDDDSLQDEYVSDSGSEAEDGDEEAAVVPIAQPQPRPTGLRELSGALAKGRADRSAGGNKLVIELSSEDEEDAAPSRLKKKRRGKRQDRNAHPRMMDIPVGSQLFNPAVLAEQREKFQTTVCPEFPVRTRAMETESPIRPLSPPDRPPMQEQNGLCVEGATPARRNEVAERLMNPSCEGMLEEALADADREKQCQVLARYGQDKPVRQIERRECSSSGQKKRVRLSRGKMTGKENFDNTDVQCVDLDAEDSGDVVEVVLPGAVEIGDGFDRTDCARASEDALDELVSRVENIRLRSVTKVEEREIASVTRNVLKKDILATVKEANIRLCGEDFSCLRGSRWLNDEVMNSFVGLINSRNCKYFHGRCGQDGENQPNFSREVEFESHDQIFVSSRPRTHVFNTFFMARLSQNDYDYNGVRRWLKRAGKKIDQLDLILVPMNLSNLHWVLVGIDLRHRHFLYLDSMMGKDCGDSIETLKRWLADEISDKIDRATADKLNISQWRSLVNPSYLPRQLDGGSCGVFTLYMAEYLERGKRPDFIQDNITTMRQRTVLFLKHGALPCD